MNSREQALAEAVTLSQFFGADWSQGACDRVADALERWKQAWYERGRLAGKAEGLREAAAKFRDNQFVRRMDQRGMVQALPEYVDLWAFSPKKHADAIADWLDQKAAEIEAQLAGEERNSAHPID